MGNFIPVNHFPSIFASCSFSSCNIVIYMTECGVGVKLSSFLTELHFLTRHVYSCWSPRMALRTSIPVGLIQSDPTSLF